MIDPPFFDTEGMPEPENSDTWHLWNLLDDLNGFAANFEAAVRLLDHCEDLHVAALQNDGPEERRLFLWPFIPARDGAITIYQFGWTLVTSIPDGLRRCPTVSAGLDHETLRTIRREFKERFPHYALLRNAVGHAAELTQSREHINNNAAKGTSGFDGFIRGNLMHKTLVYTIKGNQVTAAIDASSAGALWDFTRRTIAAFTASGLRVHPALRATI